MGRAIQDILTSEIFAKLLKVHDILGRNPGVSEISLVLSKGLKPLLEIGSFPNNVAKFIEQIHQSMEDFRKALPKPLTQMDHLDFSDNN
jgi:hypothetical protein